MTLVTSVANSKGGVTKTTSTVFLGVALSAYGKVLCVDADPQGSLYDWYASAEEAGDRLPFDVQIANASALSRKLPGSEAYDFVLIDTPPGNAGIIQATLSFADVVIMPVQAAPMDVNRMWATLDVLGGVPVIALMANLDKDTALVRETREAIDADESLVRFDSEIPHNQAIRKALGTTPKDLYGYGAVAHELLTLMKES